MAGRHVQGGGELQQHVQLHSLAPFLDVADGAAFQSDPMRERLLVQALLEPGAADPTAELLVEVIHACMMP